MKEDVVQVSKITHFNFNFLRTTILSFSNYNL